MLPGCPAYPQLTPRRSRPPLATGVQIRTSLLGPKLLCAARPTPESSLLSCAGREARDRNVPSAGRTGRRRPGRMPSSSAQPPGSLSVLTIYPPGGKILLHAQQPLAQGLQHLCHSVSSRQVSDSRHHPRAPALVTRAPRTFAARPAPARVRVRPQHRSPFRVRPPFARFRPAPHRPAQPQWAAPGSEKGQCFPPRGKSRCFNSLDSLNPGPLVFLFKMKVVS